MAETDALQASLHFLNFKVRLQRDGLAANENQLKREAASGKACSEKTDI